VITVSQLMDFDNKTLYKLHPKLQRSSNTDQCF